MMAVLTEGVRRRQFATSSRGWRGPLKGARMVEEVEKHEWLQDLA